MDPQALGPIVGLLFGGGVCVFVVVIVIVGAVFGARHAKAQNEKWAAWASQRGLALSGAYPMIQVAGTMHGVGVQMVTHRYVHRRNRRSHVSYKHELIATPPMHIGDLMLSREGFFASIGKAFGGQDIVTGDPKFDQTFVVRSGNEHAARAVLGHETRAALLDALAALGDLHVESGGVRCLRQGTANPDHLDHGFQALVRAAQAFGR